MWAESHIGKETNFDLNKKLVRFITHFKNTSTTRQTIKKKKGYITPVMGYYPRNRQMGDGVPCSDMQC